MKRSTTIHIVVATQRFPLIGMGTGRGLSLAEPDDPVAVSRLASAWSDLVDQKTVAVVGDEEIAAALG